VQYYELLAFMMTLWFIWSFLKALLDGVVDIVLDNIGSGFVHCYV